MNTEAEFAGIGNIIMGDAQVFCFKPPVLKKAVSETCTVNEAAGVVVG